MSALLSKAAVAARIAAPLLVGFGVAVAASPVGCSSADDTPVTEGTLAQSSSTGAAITGDALPGGSISFFNRGACPEGWAPFADGAGRIIVPTTADDPTLTVQGTPLKDGEDRAHGHAITAEMSLPAVSYVGVAGCCNKGVAGAQTVTFTTATDKVSSGVPYVQLLACKKLGASTVAPTALPKGLMIFYNGAKCPEGFTQPMATQGRMLVGLPEGAMAGVTFGGSALKSAEGRTHMHAVKGMLATTPHGIALGSGCCGDGYAKDGTYEYAGTSDEVKADLPTIQVLQCQKE